VTPQARTIVRRGGRINESSTTQTNHESNHPSRTQCPNQSGYSPAQNCKWEESEVRDFDAVIGIGGIGSKGQSSRNYTHRKTGIGSTWDFWLAAARSLSPPKSARQSLQVIHREASRRCGPPVRVFPDGSRAPSMRVLIHDWS